MPIAVADRPGALDATHEAPNLTPILLCEGPCTGHTPHRFLRAEYEAIATGYKQVYACNECHTERVWGRTIIR